MGDARDSAWLPELDVLIARAALIDETGFRRIRAGLPAERRERCDAYHHARDRYASAVCFALLQFLWRERRAEPMPPLERGSHGKPRYPPRYGMEFNWSHDAAACVCAIGASPVGIDVQSRVPFDAGLFERIATATERPLRNRFAQADDLSLLWSRKEALIKRTGLGMSASLTGVDTIGESSLVSFSSDEVAAVFSASIDGMSQSGFCHRARVRIAELRPDDTSPAADDLAVAPASDLAATPADDPSTSAAWRARPLAVTICSMPAG